MKSHSRTTYRVRARSPSSRSSCRRAEPSPAGPARLTGRPYDAAAPVRKQRQIAGGSRCFRAGGIACAASNEIGPPRAPLVRYLKALKRTGTHGSHVAGVMTRLIEEGIRQATREDFIQKNRGRCVLALVTLQFSRRLAEPLDLCLGIGIRRLTGGHDCFV